MLTKEFQIKESDKKRIEDKIIVVRNNSYSYLGKSLGLDNLSNNQIENFVKNIGNLL